jgi:hypothetical protein
VVDSARSYAVVWRPEDGDPVTGKLTPDGDALRFQGGRDGRLVHLTVPYRALAGVRVARTPGERLNGRSTIVVERHGDSALLISPLGAGLLHELSDVLADLCSASDPVHQIAVVLPLKPDALDAARRYLSLGPPFDPADHSLSRHEVYLGAREAIFVFSGADACESIRRIMRDNSVFPALGRWHDLLDGPPHLAEAGFAWRAGE